MAISNPSLNMKRYIVSKKSPYSFSWTIAFRWISIEYPLKCKTSDALPHIVARIVYPQAASRGSSAYFFPTVGVPFKGIIEPAMKTGLINFS